MARTIAPLTRESTDLEKMTGRTPPPIFFLHGPKGGGTALRSRFARAFAAEEVSPTIERIPSDRDLAAWGAFAGFRFLNGHCGYEVYRAIGANHRLVTNFRLPVDRVVSLYDYWRNNFGDDDAGHNYETLNAPRFARQLTFSEFIRSDELAVKLYVRNAHSRQLLESAWLYRDLNFIDLLTLKWRIGHMHWFYICENPAMSEIWFKHQFSEIPPDPLAIENATNYAEKPRTIPTAEDLEILRRNNAYDLAIHAYASRLLQRRVSALTEPSRSAFGYSRVVDGLRFLNRLPRTIARIERRIEALENGGRVASPSPPPQPVPVAEPVAATPIVAAEPRPDPAHLRYLAYAEQIPRDRPIYIVGLDRMATWTLRLLRSRGYTVKAFIADVPDPPETYCALPVTRRTDNFKELSRDDVVLIASPHRDSLVGEFEHTENLFDVTPLFQFVTEFCERDPNGLLLDDLGISYWRIMLAQADRYGDVWRRLNKRPADQYVRNIESASGPGSRFVVNIGCGDGLSADPCYPLYKDGWKGCAVDSVAADHRIGKAARANLALPGVALTLGISVTPGNVKTLLVENGTPVDCDLIRVNADGYDGPVIQTILEGGWRPRVFCLEINADIPPPFRFAVEFNEGEARPLAEAAQSTQTLRDIGMYGCSAAWAADMLHKHGYRFAQYEFGFPKAIGGARYMVFIRDDVFDASEATPGIAWDDAYYAEPLAWSPIKAGLKIDIRDWRHAKNPVEQANTMKTALREGTKKALGREISFMLDC
jgi:hypothetical protein